MPSPTEFYPLKSVILGAKRMMSRPINQRRPITPPLLAWLVAASDWGSPLRCLYLTLWLTFARLASVVPTQHGVTYSPRLHMAWRHIRFDEAAVTITLNTTKTIQCQERRLTFVVRQHPSPSVCLFTQLLQWRAASPRTAPDDPVFLKAAGSLVPMSRQTADGPFRAALRRAGMRPAKYGWASFRRGGATSYFLATGDVETIKAQGDWMSTAYQKYLAIPAESRAHVARQLQDLVA